MGLARLGPARSRPHLSRVERSEVRPPTCAAAGSPYALMIAALSLGLGHGISLTPGDDGYAMGVRIDWASLNCEATT
eukprot:scaffold3884_cov392-Prasinococcus_capsulatus_cf.AAC.22